MNWLAFFLFLFGTVLVVALAVAIVVLEDYAEARFGWQVAAWVNPGIMVAVTAICFSTLAGFLL